MAWIVIECHGDAVFAAICTDEYGNNLVFDDLEAAWAEANECQDGKVLEI